MIYRLVLSVSLLALSSCATQQPITFTDFSEQFPEQKREQPARVKFEFDPACNDAGDCFVKEKRLNSAARVISKLNDTIEEMVNAYNSMLQSLIHSEFSAEKLRQAYHHLEKQNKWCETASLIKQGVLGVTCAALLGTK